MKIGIISDSHDHHANILKAIDIFNEHKVKYILHAGDIVSPFSARAFSNVNDAKFIAVFGNCDGEKFYLKSTIEDIGGQIYEYIYTGQLNDKKIFMTHIPNTLDEVAGSGKFDLVIYGHTHKQDIRKLGNTLIVNPGETTDWITAKSAVVILELDDMHTEVVDL